MGSRKSIDTRVLNRVYKSNKGTVHTKYLNTVNRVVLSSLKNSSDQNFKRYKSCFWVLRKSIYNTSEFTALISTALDISYCCFVPLHLKLSQSKVNHSPSDPMPRVPPPRCPCHRVVILPSSVTSSSQLAPHTLYVNLFMSYSRQRVGRGMLQGVRQDITSKITKDT